MHSHYNPGGFPRICAAPAFPPASKRGTELDSGYSGKRSIKRILGRLDIIVRRAGLLWSQQDFEWR